MFRNSHGKVAPGSETTGIAPPKRLALYQRNDWRSITRFMHFEIKVFGKITKEAAS
ncbi:MAG: hypothetical protein RIG62_14725 [Cyclobacteriaceae bacterium]